jgi:4-hydroxy-tetrahydrodipicolinate synthase
VERMIDFTIRGKIDYLVTLGTTGESATMSEDEQLQVLDFTLQKVNGRVPVVVGIGGNNTAAVVDKLKKWPLDNVVAVLCVSPYYNKPSQEGIYQHYAALANASPKPVILYNVPGRTSSNIAAETTIRLANDFSNIIGIKEASGNMVQCMHLIKNRPQGFLLISGDDHVTLPLIACGFDGVISVIANSSPAEFCQLVHMAMAGNFAEARKFQSAMLDKMDMLFVENNPAGVKAFLAEMGLIKNYLRLPLVPLSEKWMDKLRKLV